MTFKKRHAEKSDWQERHAPHSGSQVKVDTLSQHAGGTCSAATKEGNSAHSKPDMYSYSLRFGIIIYLFYKF